MVSSLINWIKETLAVEPSYFDVDANQLKPDRKKWVLKNPKEYPRADNPPAFVTNETAWNNAKEAVKPNWNQYKEPWAVVVHVYEQMTGES